MSKSQGLSMKLRTESLTGAVEEEALRRSRKRLPQIAKKKFVTGKQFDAPKSENIYERLSGSYQFDNNMGILADRHPILHPSALCVRCSNAACMCMECSELLCNNAVIFFRKSRAVGASQLFANSVREAGMSKATLFMIFRLWKHGFSVRKKASIRMKNIVERMFGNSCLFNPFKAWQRFTKENLMNRKDKKMQEMSQKILQMEYTIKDMAKDKHKLEGKVATLQRILEETDHKFADNRVFIKDLHSKIAKERVRVVGMAELVEVLTHTLHNYHQLFSKDLSAIGSELLNATSLVTSHNYSDFFRESDRKSILRTREQRSDRYYSTALEYQSEIAVENAVCLNMMISWINAMSSRCSNCYAGKECVDEYLPAFQEMRSFSSIQDGKQLSRVIVCLIYDSMDPTNTLHTNSGELTFGEAQLKELGRFSNSPFFLVACCVQYSARFLHTPPFEIHGLRADLEVFKAYVSYLMHVANPVLMQREVEQFDNFSNNFEAAQTEFNNIENKLEDLDMLFDVQKKCEAICGRHCEQRVSYQEHSGEENEDQVSTDIVEGEEHAKLTAESKEALTEMEDLGVGNALTFEDEIIKDVYPAYAYGEKYDRLAESISSLIESDNYPDNVADVVARSTSTSKSIVDLRNKLHSILNQKLVAVRLTSDINSHLHAHSSEYLLRKVKWVADKLEDLPTDIPFEIA